MSELEPKPKRRGQMRFPPDETAVKGFEVAMIVISLACVAAVLAIVLGTDWGDTFRPQI